MSEQRETTVATEFVVPEIVREIGRMAFQTYQTHRDRFMGPEAAVILPPEAIDRRQSLFMMAELRREQGGALVLHGHVRPPAADRQAEESRKLQDRIPLLLTAF